MSKYLVISSDTLDHKKKKLLIQNILSLQVLQPSIKWEKENLKKLEGNEALVIQLYFVEELNIYEIAENLRSHRGGAAVVLGSLSPRTRNAQVEIYEEKKIRKLIGVASIIFLLIF
mgnify:CR=1 FL=1